MAVKLPYPDDFAPDATAFKGGIDRMVKIFDTLRDQNGGGYGGGVVQQIGTGANKWEVTPSKVTSCSPFTATVIGMLYDPNLATSGSSFQPMYDKGKTPLPHFFYSMHQGNFLKARPQFRSGFRANGWEYADSSTGSMLFYNLGYKIKATDIRRGDLVGITWPDNGGHAVFVWDVHLDANGKVDAFCLVSSNSAHPPKGKVLLPGISIAGCYWPNYLSGDPGSITKAKTPLFQDRPSHIHDAQWYPLPGKTGKDIDKTTFKTIDGKPGAPSFFMDRYCGWYVADMEAVRLWGVRPPDRRADNDEGAVFDLANQLGHESPKEPYAVGKGAAPAPHVENAPTVVHKSDPDSVKKAPPKPVKQHPQRPTEPQQFVESALQRLYMAKWIDKDPGQSTDINDPKTKAAVEDFQQKFPDAKPVDGIPGPITRRALRRALDDLDAGKPGPKDPKQPPPPKLDRVAWLVNRVDAGGSTFLALHGQNLDPVDLLKVTLVDRKSKAQAAVDLPIVLVDGIGVTPLVVPAAFKDGAEITATFDGTAAGTKLHYKSDVPLYIGPVVAASSDDWPWADARWTQKMRDIANDLRSTPPGTGPFERFEITQFGVKEKVDAGDVAVKSKSGEVYGKVTLRSLMLADIEGTMRLDGRILNITQSGNVYEPKEVIVDGKKVTKNKPNPAKFDPSKSLWVDVTDRAPWGSGARMPLVPYRTLAINPKLNPSLYYKKVYIKQLDGMTMSGTNEKHNGICIVGDAGGMRQTHFDLFVGREDHHISIKSVGTGDATICEIQVLGDCAASHPGKK